MKYEKLEIEVIAFDDHEFMAGSGNWDGGYCKNYSNNGYTCGYVEHCTDYSTLIPCNNWFECDDFGLLGFDMGFYCRGFA